MKARTLVLLYILVTVSSLVPYSSVCDAPIQQLGWSVQFPQGDDIVSTQTVIDINGTRSAVCVNTDTGSSLYLFDPNGNVTKTVSPFSWENVRLIGVIESARIQPHRV